MEVDKERESPFATKSCDEVGTLHIVDLSKKRKLQPEPFDLSNPKHICFAKVANEAIGFEHKSAQGSNSFVDDTASSSTAVWSSENRMDSSGSVEADDMEIRTEDDINSLPSDGPINLRQILEEQLLEFKARSHHIEEDDAMEQSGDNETDDNILNSDDNDPNAKSYVLPSGKWNIDTREPPTNTKRKPTIDKEFEQYFSTLML